jgi:hypothetical protein
MINRRFFEIGELKEKRGIYVKLSQFLHTDKEFDQCSSHFRYWKKYKNRNAKEAIDD